MQKADRPHKTSQLLTAKLPEVVNFRLFGVHIDDMSTEELKGAIGYMLIHPELSILHNQKKDPYAYRGLGPLEHSPTKWAGLGVLGGLVVVLMVVFIAVVVAQ